MTEAHGFRRAVSVAKIGDAGLAQTVTAKPEETAAIAAYLELAGVKSLTGEFALTRWRTKGIRVAGTLAADLIQTCVVTLEPIETRVEAEFERRFLPAEKLKAELADLDDVVIDPAGEDPPEPLGHDIDLGEILIEELALNIDPYPRKPGAEFQDEHAEPKANPFAVLAKLKPKKL
jgi:uncharacterized metal-binding protein YceD (DUF177 family)